MDMEDKEVTYKIGEHVSYKKLVVCPSCGRKVHSGRLVNGKFTCTFCVIKETDKKTQILFQSDKPKRQVVMQPNGKFTFEIMHFNGHRMGWIRIEFERQELVDILESIKNVSK